jgi:hypothetical protein
MGQWQPARAPVKPSNAPSSTIEVPVFRSSACRSPSEVDVFKIINRSRQDLPFGSHMVPARGFIELKADAMPAKHHEIEAGWLAQGILAIEAMEGAAEILPSHGPSVRRGKAK